LSILEPLEPFSLTDAALRRDCSISTTARLRAREVAILPDRLFRR